MRHTSSNLLIAYIRLIFLFAIVDSNYFQFGNMLRCFHQNMQPMDYADYGCYCGPGGQGRPVDDTDWCWAMHDKCWEEVYEDPECTGFTGPHLITYNWGCSSTKIHCYDGPYTCDRKTCECDRIATECFAKTRPTYDEKNYELSVEHCKHGHRQNNFQEMANNFVIF